MRTIHIADSTYRDVAQQLLRNIEWENFWNGEINTLEGTLSATVIVHRDTVNLPEGQMTVIEDIVPIWWEFHSFDEEGEEFPNNFNFGTLKEWAIN